MEHVLITGGSGTIGRALTQVLQQAGYEVAWMSRKAGQGSVKRFVWDIEKKTLDEEAIRWADHIIHLAGADVAEKRWTSRRKQELYDSRVKSANLIVSEILKQKVEIKTFMSASGINYYSSEGDGWQREGDPPGEGFMSELCVAWEAAVKPVGDLRIRLVIFRTGPVLSVEGGLLEPFKLPLKFGIAPYFGNGRQFYSWIHIRDLCRIFLHALEQDSVKGIYNAVAPNPVRNKQFIKEVVRGMRTVAILLPVPRIVLTGIMGERGNIPYFNNQVANEAICSTGFDFEFTSVQEAVSDLFRK